MIKIFIVDDEPVILRTIKKMITETHPDFDIVGEALNGQDALPMIEALVPDVLFTDIRMPLMDGLALIETLHLKKIFPVTVLLTGYAEFEYAKKAIQLGTMEYLLKPLSYESLEDLLNSIYKKWHYKERQQQLSILQKIVSDSTGLPHINTSKLNRYFQNLQLSYILLCSGSYSIFYTNWITPAKNFWLTNYFEEISKEIIPSSFLSWFIDGIEGNEKILILASAKVENEQVTSMTEQVFQQLKNYGQQITAISGPITSQMSDIGYMIQMSRLHLHQNIVFGQSKMIDRQIDQNIHTKDGPITITPYESTLTVFARNGQTSKFLQEVYKILEVCRKESASQLNIELLLKKILNIYTDTLSDKLQNESYSKHLELDELISNVSDYDSLFEGISFLIRDLSTSQINLTKENFNPSKTIEDVETYIKNNYAKPLSINIIAEQFGYTQSQLSNVFKKYKGIPPSTFLIQLRVEKAKELLLIQPPITLRDIAVSVGYEDPFYFSPIFKLCVGISPSEYRVGLFSN